MRILVVSTPLLRSVQSVLPLGRALRDAGHEVLLATAGEAAVADLDGLPVEDVAPRFSYLSTGLRMALRHPLLTRAERKGTAGTRAAALTFGSVNDQLADSLVALAERWQPDLVVHDPLAVAGALAAATAGVPAVLLDNTLIGGPELAAVTVARFRRGRGLPPTAATISIAPPSVVGSRPGLPMRFLPYGEQAGLPDWLTRPPSRPRIAVDLGRPGSRPLMTRAIAAVEDIDADLVLIEPETHVPQPPRTGSAGPVPLAAVLRHCAAVIHQAEASGVLAALHAGVPQLAVNGNSAHRHNAAAVARRGAALASDDLDITTDLVTRLITDPTLAGSAAQVAAEMAAMPDPAQLVGRLEEVRASAAR
jgi:UDP:flavonoid glycosyltransferase YjiC (YdhE family)